MGLEGIKEQVEQKYKIDLSSWTSIFRSLKALSFNVIVESENPEDESFDIGPLTKVSTAAVWIRYFDAKGMFNEAATRIRFDFVSIVTFDDLYSRTFGKYLRERKSKKQAEA